MLLVRARVSFPPVVAAIRGIVSLCAAVVPYESVVRDTLANEHGRCWLCKSVMTANKRQRSRIRGVVAE